MMKRLVCMKAIGWLFIGLSLAACNRQGETKVEDSVAADTSKVETPQDAVERLLAGNKRYVEGKSVHPHNIPHHKKHDKGGRAGVLKWKKS